MSIITDEQQYTVSPRTRKDHYRKKINNKTNTSAEKEKRKKKAFHIIFFSLLLWEYLSFLHTKANLNTSDYPERRIIHGFTYYLYTISQETSSKKIYKEYTVKREMLGEDSIKI